MATLTNPSVLDPASPIRVYLVEDSPQIREMIGDELNAMPGLTVAGYAETESEALLELCREPFDVIIFDIHLKQGNSISLLSAMAKKGCQINALKLVFSTHVESACRRLCEKYGVRRVFDKAFEYLNLCETLRSIGRARVACQGQF
ncbi:hypothetical protein BH11PSE11_BH11PSE11_20640 [soil metagenome]